jgi:hypothetical protein
MDHNVIPAKAGIQFRLDTELLAWNWIPAVAGMTSRSGLGRAPPG